MPGLLGFEKHGHLPSLLTEAQCACNAWGAPCIACTSHALRALQKWKAVLVSCCALCLCGARCVHCLFPRQAQLAFSLVHFMLSSGCARHSHVAACEVHMHGHLVGCAILKYISEHLLYRGLHRRAQTSFDISTVLETNIFDELNIRFEPL